MKTADNNKLKKYLRLFNCIAVIGLVIATVLWVFVVIIPETRLGEPPSWMGIIPGQTNNREVMKYIGQPDQIDIRGSYQTYIYRERDNLDWKLVEIWFKGKGENMIVIGINQWGSMLPIPNFKYSLEDIVVEYGKPDFVTWTTGCNSRYLIWASQGVAVDSEYWNNASWHELRIYERFLFEPTNLIWFLLSNWPWPLSETGFSFNEMCLAEDIKDNAPVDPYDWDNIPTP